MNWEQKYELEITKIPKEYFEERLNIIQKLPFEKIYRNKKEFCVETKEKFLIHIKSNPSTAFRILHSHLPLLAEHLIYRVHKEKLLEEKIFCECFSRIYLWTGKRNTLFKYVINYKELIQIFSEYDFMSIMDNEAKEIWKKLPKNVNVFRGVAGLSLNEAKTGVSWSLNREIAITFAQENQKHFNTTSNLVLDAIIPKNKIYGLFLVRGEAEVIIDSSEIILINSTEVKIEDDNIQDYNPEEEIPEAKYPNQA